MKLLLIGHLVISTKLIIALKKTGISFSILSTETESLPEKTFQSNLYQDADYIGRIYSDFKSNLIKYLRFIFSFPFLASYFSKLIANKISRQTKNNSFKIILANWGTGIIPEINILKSLVAFKNSSVILNMETFPTGWNSRFREYLEILILRMSLKNIDGLIIPTDEMYNLLVSKNIDLHSKKIFRSPFYFDMSYFKISEKKKIEPQYDLIFFGKPDLFRSLNSVQNQLLELADSGITIGCSKEFNIKHLNIHSFDSFHIYDQDFDPSRFSMLYKAALVAFNISNKKSYPLRFDTSLPHRFLFPLALKLPIVLQKEGFKAIGKIVDQFEIGFRYNSIENLKTYLNSDSVKESKLKIKENEADLDFNVVTFKEYLAKFS